MHEIVSKREIAPEVKEFVVRAPVLARKARAGQFVIVRISEDGERIPLTIADADAAAGTITLVVQEVGKTTIELGRLREGDAILDLVGPLGRPSHVERFGTVCMIGGGIGVAPIYPIAVAMQRRRQPGDLDHRRAHEEAPDPGRRRCARRATSCTSRPTTAPTASRAS